MKNTAAQVTTIGFNASQAPRFKMEWEATCKEPISVECIGGTMYAYCSELAALRLGLKYASALVDKTAKVAYSENLGTWFFRLEPKF